MGYIARNLESNKVFYSKGLLKIAEKIGCNHSTLTRFFSKVENIRKDKTIKGWIITFVEEIPNKNRGKNIKSTVLHEKY